METTGRSLLREFRGDFKVSLPLHPLEKCLIVLVAVNVCALPWMFGGMRTWAQLIALGLSVASMVIALLPRTYDGNLVHKEAYRYYSYRKLIHWPVFWLGLAFFSYAFIQAFNPAWEVIQLPKTWTLRKIDHVEWLPTSIKSSYDPMDAWRQMVIWGAPFLTACAIWIGFTRRRSLLWLVTLLVGNILAVSAFGLLQRITEAKKIYWTVHSANEFWGAFVYRNHGAAYLVLGFMLTLALAAWTYGRTKQRQKKSGPALLLTLMAVVVAVSVAASYSRGAVVALCVSLLWVVGAGLLRLITGERTVRAITVIIPLALLLGALGTLSLKAFDAKHTYERFVLLMDSASTTWQSRQIATTATKEMWEDQKWTGWGAGSFRFIFPRYQQRHPSITWYNPKWKSGYYYWEYAHNDWIQLLAELGVIGAVLIGTTILTGVVLLVRQQGYQHDFVLLLVGGCLTTCLHARGDFLFHNPAILNLWTACAMAALVISQLDRRESRPFIHQQKQSSSRG